MLYAKKSRVNLLAQKLLMMEKLTPYVSGILTSIVWLWWFGFRLKPISGDDRANPEIVADFENGQKWYKYDGEPSIC